MTDKASTLDNLPVQLITQLDEVAVFQTKAFATNEAKPLVKNQQPQKALASYGELNLGLHVNDDSRQVLSNRMRLLSAINSQLSLKHQSTIASLHWVNQVHGKHIHIIDSKSACLNMQPLNADAMVSQHGNVGLAIMTADCVPITLYQPATGQIAAIHAGWQGLACGVIKATFERFDSSKPIMAWIGACISQANYEVDRQLLDKLRAGCTVNKLLDVSTLKDFELLFSRPSTTEVKLDDGRNNENKINSDDLYKSIDKLSNCATLSTDKVYADKVKLNLPKLAAAQLNSLAIRVANDAAIDCSYENSSYYSYRRQTHLQQPATGRMALVIVRSR